MIVIGISGLAHDAAACLIVDGKLIMAIEEERITRKKNAWTFPKNAILKLLELNNFSVSEVDYIAFYWDDAGSFFSAASNELKSIFNSNIPTFSRIRKRLESMRSHSIVFKLLHECGFTNLKKKVVFLNHHDCHAAYGVIASNYYESAILCVDGRGEHETISEYVYKNHTLSKISSTNMPHSLGFVYGALTQHLGFQQISDEYRVMGLAPFGEPCNRLKKYFSELIQFEKGQKLKINTELIRYQFSEDLNASWLSKKSFKVLGSKRNPNEEIKKEHANIAYALQSRYEEALNFLVSELHRKTQLNNIVICGGTAMNSVANGKLTSCAPFRNIFIPPAPGDQGCSIGAALLVCKQNDKVKIENKTFSSANLGPCYSDIEIEEQINQFELNYIKPDDINGSVARLISEGKICGYFQGRMEFGPRALGNRSILGDARISGLQDIINDRIKMREKFRPFACSILAEEVQDYFEGPYDSRYMSFVRPIKSKKRSLVPAVTHVDGSCRLQTVKFEQNQLYYDLLKKFKKITGIPLILNTSFNLKGEPIVMTPKDAIFRYKESRLDALAIGSFLIEKKSNL